MVNKKRESQLKYHINENLFNIINSEEKAYWLGFIYADGNIYQNKLQIALCIKDKIHLENFLNFAKSNHRLYKDRHLFRLGIRCSNIIHNLQLLGVNFRKSLTLQFPNNNQLPNDYIRHFIRGYFDGDGSICFYKKTGYFSIIGTKDFLHKIQDYFILNNLPKNKLILEKRRGHNCLFYLSYGGNFSIRKIYHILYDNSNVRLERKKKVFDNVFATLR